MMLPRVTITPQSRQCMFLGLRFNDVSPAEAVECLLGDAADGAWRYIVTPNAAHLARLSREKSRYRHVYDKAALCLLDSRVIRLLARNLGLDSPRVCTGADLTLALLAEAGKARLKICIIGGGDGSISALRDQFGLVDIDFLQPTMGFINKSDEVAGIIDFIRESGARLTFLAVGSPQQEILAHHVLERGNASGIGVCCGAAIEFAAGARRRAPILVQKACLEWAYRLCLEPRRMASRYFFESPPGVMLVLRHALRR